MPELPEVETVRRGIAPALEGRVIARVVVRRPDLRRPFPDRFAERLAGRRVTGVGRRAKYLLCDLDDGAVLIAHLGMSGRMTVHAGAAPPPGPHDHVDLVTDQGTVVRFADPRRFGLMDLCPKADLARHPLFAHLGPEPLGADFDGPALAARLSGRKSAIKVALLDQKVVAGVGNIYASEALFRARVAPTRLAGALSKAENERLAQAIRTVLLKAIAAGGSSLRDHRQASGELGYFQHDFAVYDRAGGACPVCAAPVARLVQGGRATFFCPRCQR